MPEPFHYTPTARELEEAVASMILSASGWRKVFADSEESHSPELRPVDRLLALGMADTFATFLQQSTGRTELRVAVGMDSRFTGPALADAMVRVLLGHGVRVDFLGIVAAPEIMGWVQTAGVHDGFVYVSASHNPVGHNGVKFGLGNGGVVGGAQAADLIARFRAAVTPEGALAWQARASQARPDEVERTLGSTPAKSEARQAYATLSDEILTGSAAKATQAARKAELRALVGQRGLGIVAELNGSARGLSIDKQWLAELGVQTIALNDTPRQFVHRIVPEGPSLDLCRSELERLNRTNPAFQLGYVPDCDGDRGNVVFFDPAQGKARILEAQEVFALCVLSELAGLEYYGEAGDKVAVACNDPTSLRIDAIAQAFGARVCRAEVGEANVVGLARSLRAEGYTVRILGEGSNGGNITYPGSVRDPLSTLGSLLKLTSLRSTTVAGTARPGLFELWCQRSGQSAAYRDDYTLADVLATLPAWTTTPASEDRAMLKITTSDHARLKARFEALWPQKWAQRRQEWTQRLGAVSWTEFNYEGMKERQGVGAEFRTGRQTGGLKIVLQDASGAPVACLWMRGSGTEPVFRILAEVKGHDAAAEDDLLAWLAQLVALADRDEVH